MGQHQQTTDLLADGGDHLEFAPGVRMGASMLNVDHANNAIPADDRSRQKSLEGIFGKVAKVFKSGIAISLARNRQQTAFARDPSGQTLLEPQADLADRARLLVVRCAEHQFCIIEEIDKTGIALHELNDESNDTLQRVMQTHLTDHEAADLLNQPQLLLRTFESLLEFAYPVCHDRYYLPEAGEVYYPREGRLAYMKFAFLFIGI